MGVGLGAETGGRGGGVSSASASAAATRVRPPAAGTGGTAAATVAKGTAAAGTEDDDPMEMESLLGMMGEIKSIKKELGITTPTAAGGEAAAAAAAAAAALDDASTAVPMEGEQQPANKGNEEGGDRKQVGKKEEHEVTVGEVVAAIPSGRHTGTDEEGEEGESPERMRSSGSSEDGVGASEKVDDDVAVAAPASHKEEEKEEVGGVPVEQPNNVPPSTGLVYEPLDEAKIKAKPLCSCSIM